MKRVSTVIKQLVDALSLERVAVAVSVLYCVGVALLLQYNAIHFGDFDFDFVRVKPIVVGISYFIYLALPLVVLFLPFIATSKKCFNWFWEWWAKKTIKRPVWFQVSGRLIIGVGLLLMMMLALGFALGLMFHYFIPYSEYLFELHPSPWISLPQISWAFWQLYFYQDLHLLGFLLLGIACTLIVLRYCETVRFSTKGRIRIFSIMTTTCVILGFFTNMFYFGRDVYPNISQAAAGGAPVTGILTIDCPGEQERRGLDGRIIECDEITKFCSVVQADATYVYIDDQLANDRGIRSGTCRTSRYNSTRIRKNDVKQFTPLNIPMFCRRGFRTILGGGMREGIVLDVDLYVEHHFRTVSLESARQATHCLSVTNQITATWQGEGFPPSVIRATKQRVVREGPTNLCYTIEFGHVAIPAGTVVPELLNCITNSYAECVIKGQPDLPPGVSESYLSAGFLVNHVMTVSWYDKPIDKYGREITLMCDHYSKRLKDSAQKSQKDK